MPSKHLHHPMVKTFTTFGGVFRRMALMTMALAIAFPTTATAQFTAYDCPSVGDAPIELTETSVELTKFRYGVCTVTAVSTDPEDPYFAPIARSYDNKNWEVSAGRAAGKFSIDCSGINPEAGNTGCRMTLPPLGDSEAYVLTSYGRYARTGREEGKKAVIVRFLEKASFGVTPADLTSSDLSHTAASFKRWVIRQMELPITSHREFYRKRANERTETPMTAGEAGPHPCSKESRWRNFAFTSQDTGKSLTIESAGGGDYLLKVDGVPRTLVLSKIELVKFSDNTGTINVGSATDAELDTEYVICGTSATFYQESVSAPFRVKKSGQNDSKCRQFRNGNPPVYIDPASLSGGSGGDNAYMVDLPALDAGFIGIANVDDNTYTSELWEAFQADDEFRLTEDLADTACDAIEINPNTITPTVFGRTVKNGMPEYLLYDPHLVLLENTLENPLADGGGAVALSSDNKVKCPNVARSFINEDHCVLSTAPTACSADEPPVFSVKLTEDFLKRVYSIEGRYVYAVENLPLNDETYTDKRGRVQRYQPPPCARFRNRYSRWMRVGDSFCAGNDYRHVGDETEAAFATLLQPGFDGNMEEPPLQKDVRLFETQTCSEADEDKTSLGYIKGLDGQCWQHVHSLNLNVYDLTTWASEHNGGAYNIQKWAEHDLAILTFPNSHHSNGNFRFYTNIVNKSKQRPLLGKLGDMIPFSRLPENLQTDSLREEFGSVPVNPSGNGVVVCGSIGEVANDPSLGSGFFVESFDDDRFPDNPVPTSIYRAQRQTIWAHISLNSADQLRQRVAFALSQILVVSPQLLGETESTENNLDYFDIFVRGAFGSYRDILKRVAFHDRMGEMLSSIGSTSFQYSKDFGRTSHPDENFAREIMQLFSIGLYELNMDGTAKLDSQGEPIQTYDNDDITSFARAWTGMRRQQTRGNYEMGGDRVDPMIIHARWRDVFPKSNLYNGFLGDQYPLCSDLPPQHFLRKGAVYRLLGSKASPELQKDMASWENDPEIIRLSLDSSSPLYSKLCASQIDGSACTYPGKVVLQENLDYTNHQDSDELNVDTIRTIRVDASPTPIYYEYVRPACAEYAFYDDAKRVVDSSNSRGATRNMLCANPLTEVAQASCCDQADLNSGIIPRATMTCAYQGERVKYATAEQRCADIGKVQCDIALIQSRTAGICAKDSNAMSERLPLSYRWTSGSCAIQAKVDTEGHVAIVHNPEADPTGDQSILSGLGKDTKNFFKVSWKDGDFPKASNNCSGSSGTCTKMGSSCICDTSTTFNPYFSSATDSTISLSSILGNLPIGAPDPTSMPQGVYRSRGRCSKKLPAGVTAYTRGGSSTCSNFNEETVFRVVDKKRVLFLKNVQPTVAIGNDDFSFRNPVHFMSFANPEARDAYHETDAALDHYFYHPSHAPFLAVRMLQRFGFSNPSPRFVKSVSNAYKKGIYSGIGSAQYGDIGALMAAILLDRESRSLALDSDPAHGQLREPLLKVIAVLRSMSYENDSPIMWPFLAGMGSKIGEGIYEAPSVFSFFLSDFVPSGGVSDASLYSPEAQAMSASTVTGMLNGLFSMTQYGLTSRQCFGGFGELRPNGLRRCESRKNVGDTSRSFGSLQFSSTATAASDLIDELSLLLTAGRLQSVNRQRIIDAISPFMDTDEDKAIRLAQQLFVTTPEFHSNNIVRLTGEPRLAEPPIPRKTNTYKAVIYLMFSGGMDSFSMLAPKSRCGSTNMYQQYSDIRGSVALPQSDLLTINASNQPCEHFGINKAFPFARTLYNRNEAMFFTNIGVLDELVTKQDWRSKTRTSLFAHNIQQKEVQRLDIEKELSESGVGGRMLDTLRGLGYRTSANMIGGNSRVVKGSPKKNHPVTQLPQGNPAPFNRGAEVDDMDDLLNSLNSASEHDSSLFGDVWSTQMVNAINDTEIMADLYSNHQVEGFKAGRLNDSFESIATWIKSRGDRDVEREVIFVSHGGYDHHAVSNSNNINTKLQEVNGALESFVAEMERQNVWDDVVIMTGSDFGRTLTPNSRGGTDHGWASNGFMMGGSIKGGVIRGTYPDDLSPDGPYNIGRGHLIPTLPYESPWNAIAEWMGVESSEGLDVVLPNRDSFDSGTLFTANDLFNL